MVWTSGSTRCWDALYLALSQFPTDNPADDQRFLVFLSDGKDESSTHTADQVRSLAQSKGVRIYCVGYGRELTPAPLQTLTAETGGQYYAAGSAAELTQRFQEVALDLRSRYILRWATLKRTTSEFTPSFEISYSGAQASATAAGYTPTSYAGNELEGRLRFDTSLNPGKVASLVLRTSYIPRGVTRLRVDFATAWPFTVVRVPFADGGVCPTDWTFTVHETNGIGCFEFASQAPANPFSALPFATLGKLVQVEFQGVTNLVECFDYLSVDNSLYAQPGGPSCVVENANAVSSPLTELPYGTPVWWLNQYGLTSGLVSAEITDHDGDGVLTWQEYLAGTNPTNAASVFRMLRAIPAGPGWEITFNTESNRLYRVEWTEGFDGWNVLAACLLGNGQPQTVVDPVARPQRFYRGVVTGITNETPPVMVLIPAGTFQMGDSFGDGASDELPVHAVTVSAFYMDRTEVTKALWDEVYTWALAHGYGFDNRGSVKAPGHPVQNINWYDCVKWCNARSEKEGLVPAYYTSASQTRVYRHRDGDEFDIQNACVKWDAGYRLPTEAEWEYAARGGLSGKRFPWGDMISHSQANYRSNGPDSYDVSPTHWYHPSYATGDHPYTSPVGSFAANGYGLHDMAGNVSEWCWDWKNWYNVSSPMSNPRGPTAGSTRVIRGGSWYSDATGCRSADRGSWGPDNKYYLYGFRSVLPAGQ